MTAFVRGAGESGADAEISGTIAIFAHWGEDIYFRDPSSGSAMDLTGLSFYFQFRSDPSSRGADVTLSTANGMLSLELDSGSVLSILRIDAGSGTFSAYEGDMIADLVAVDDLTGDEFLYAHGVVTFRNNPVAV